MSESRIATLTDRPQAICWSFYHNKPCDPPGFGTSTEPCEAALCGYAHTIGNSAARLAPRPPWYDHDPECNLRLCNPPPLPATCFFAYHGDACDGDITNSNRDTDRPVCPYSHAEVEEREIVAVAFQDGYEHRADQSTCDLEHCPLRSKQDVPLPVEGDSRAVGVVAEKLADGY